MKSGVQTESQATTNSAKPGGGRQRVISSCLTCRRRKVKCDHTHPICSSCTRGNHVCTWTDQVPASTGTGRISKPSFANSGKLAKTSDVQARLERLEHLLEKATTGQGSKPTSYIPPSVEGKPESDAQLTPSSSSQTSHSQTSHSGGIASDDGGGTLLLDGDQSQFVSSLHFALLADEIQDIKAILGDRTDEENKEIPQSSLIDLLSLGRAGSGSNLEQLLPNNQEFRDSLLEIYFTNVDPMIRITHSPTIRRKFRLYNHDAHPVCFAVYYSAINSLPPSVVLSKFEESKESLLDRFQLGVEISLAQANYLTTSSLEIFQGFMLWLTCIIKEEDMNKGWVLLGLALRIALNLGLHRDPSLFPAGSMDALTTETRRRIWYQLSHLDFRAAECKGQEPSITEDFYTTKLPRNIDDEDLLEGASPGVISQDGGRFTSMTFQLVRYTGTRALRHVVQSTYRLERRMLDSGLHGASRFDPAQELRNLYEQIKVMLDRAHDENEQDYLRFLDPKVMLQRGTLHLASLLEWRCYLIFWLRMPLAYRDVVFADDIRRSIFQKSINCIETVNAATADAETGPFQWHVGGVMSFQAIMHVISELRTPLFSASDRQRALATLQHSCDLRKDNSTKAWQAVRNLIEKAVAEHSTSPGGQPLSSNAYASPSPPRSTTLSMQNKPSEGDRRVHPAVESTLSYAYQRPAAPYTQSILSAQPQQMHPPPALINPMQPLQNQSAPCWDDMNLNNIYSNPGSIQPTQGVIPDLDFGYWGLPFNYDNDPAGMPMQDNYFPPW